jgi:hypothetical protein
MKDSKGIECIVGFDSLNCIPLLPSRKNSYIVKVSCFLLYSFFCVGSSFAHPYKVKLSAPDKNISTLIQKIQSVVEGNAEKIKQVNFKGSIGSCKRATLSFKEIEKPNIERTISESFGTVSDPVSVVFVNGSVSCANSEESWPVAGTVKKLNYKLKNKLSLLLQIRRPNYNTVSTYSLLITPQSKSKLVGRIHRQPTKNDLGDCLTLNQDGSYVNESIKSTTHKKSNIKTDYFQSAQATGLKEIELATDADSEYYAKYGADSNARISEVINGVNQIYARDLGLKLKIKKQNVYTGSSPYKSLVPEPLLIEFNTNRMNSKLLGDADLYHLFTGKNLDDVTVGIAYTGVICRKGAPISGLSQDLPVLSKVILIVAHEIGHNMAAQHTPLDPNTLMYPNIEGGGPQFAKVSKDEIANHLNRYNSCVSAVGESPAPTTPPVPVPTTRSTAERTPEIQRTPVTPQIKTPVPTVRPDPTPTIVRTPVRTVVVPTNPGSILIESFILTDELAQQVISQIEDGTVLSAEDLRKGFNIVANTSGDVRAVKILLKGVTERGRLNYGKMTVRTPYSLFRVGPSGTAQGGFKNKVWKRALLPGSYELYVRAYGKNFSSVKIEKTVTFEVK